MNTGDARAPQAPHADALKQQVEKEPRLVPRKVTIMDTTIKSDKNRSSTWSERGKARVC
jgi:hypothetical protein